jgi:hypothetical protein
MQLHTAACKPRPCFTKRNGSTSGARWSRKAAGEPAQLLGGTLVTTLTWQQRTDICTSLVDVGRLALVLKAAAD